MRRLHLSKLHATGNDFLVVADPDEHWSEPLLDREARALLCDRHFGVGADGLIRVLPGRDGAHVTMELSNADGGIAEMSGNGVRCLAAVAVARGLVTEPELTVATGAGLRRVRYEEAEVPWARVDMGTATFDPEEVPVEADSPFDLEATVDERTYRGDAVGMGNPHLVLFVDDPAAVPVARHGPVLELDPRFPRRTNVEFVSVDDGGLSMRVWERGVGETLSCGTGACAAAAAAHRRGRVGASTTVTVPGGRLGVDLDDTTWLGGPVVHVFDVDVDLDALRSGR